MRTPPADTPDLSPTPPGAAGEAADGPQDVEALRERVRAAIGDYLQSARATRSSEPEVYERCGGRLRRRGQR